MKKLIIIPIFCIILGLFNVSIFATDPTGTSGLNIYVKKSNNDPAADVSIAITGPSSYSNTQNTDSAGKVALTALAAGNYTVVINLTEADPYELKTGETASRAVTVADGETKDVTFTVIDKASPTDGDETTEPTTLQLPSIFTQTGSTSTNLTKYSDTQLKAIKNFTLHVPGFTKVIFKEPVNFSTSKDKINQLDQFVLLQQPGEISIATELAPELDKPAVVTFYGLKYNPVGEDYTPLITKDDQIPAGNEITNINLTGTDTISFSVSGFTTYSLKPILYFTQTDITADSQTYKLEGQVDDLNSEISITLNGSKINQVVEVNNDGTFTANLNLKRGTNEVKVSATGISEQVTTTDLTIKYGTVEKNNFSTDLTMVMGIALVLLGIGGGSYYLYKTKYLPGKAAGGKNKKLKVTANSENYDSRLLTPEERRVFNNDPEKE